MRRSAFVVDSYSPCALASRCFAAHFVVSSHADEEHHPVAFLELVNVLIHECSNGGGVQRCYGAIVKKKARLIINTKHQMNQYYPINRIIDCHSLSYFLIDNHSDVWQTMTQRESADF